MECYPGYGAVGITLDIMGASEKRWFMLRLVGLQWQFWTLRFEICNHRGVGGDRVKLTGETRREREGEGRKERGRGEQILGNASQQDRQSSLKAPSQRRTRTRKVGQYDNDMITQLWVCGHKAEMEWWLQQERGFHIINNVLRDLL